jgi:hypothetical protein
VVVLSLESQVALHVDFDLGHRLIQVGAQFRDVLLDQEELAVGLWCCTDKVFNLLYILKRGLHGNCAIGQRARNVEQIA